MYFTFYLACHVIAKYNVRAFFKDDFSLHSQIRYDTLNIYMTLLKTKPFLDVKPQYIYIYIYIHIYFNFF